MLTTLALALVAGFVGGLLAPVVTRFIRAKRQRQPSIAADGEVFFRVRTFDREGNVRELPFNARQGARARDAYAEGVRLEAPQVELWERVAGEWRLRDARRAR